MLTLVMAMVAVAACNKMDSTYRDFIVKNGVVYPGRATDPVAAPGRNRIRISWLRGTDPTVTHATVFWNNYADSLPVTIPATGDTITVVIDQLPEKAYTFEIVTYNQQGNPSVPVELLAQAYGPAYEATLLNRPVASSLMDGSGSVYVVWGAADVVNGAFGTLVTYVNNGDDSVTQRVEVTSDTAVLADYKPGTEFRYRTAFLPDSLSIDTFYSVYDTHPAYRKIPKSGWIASADSYSSPYVPENAIDDDLNTFWNSNYRTAPPPFPHWWQVDMGAPHQVALLDLTCRQNYLLGFDFTIQGSMDGMNWTDYDSYTLLPQMETQRYVVTGAPAMRFIRIYQTNPSMNVVPSCFSELTAYE